MYEAFWQLQKKPFENTSDAGFYYPSEAHQGAQLKLRYAIENRRGSGLLSGASGMGKTLLLRNPRAVNAFCLGGKTFVRVSVRGLIFRAHWRAVKGLTLVSGSPAGVRPSRTPVSAGS
jgi:type II secretory pathway predicted ATPase ExeA